MLRTHNTNRDSTVNTAVFFLIRKNEIMYLFDDVSQGLVPVDAEQRAFREMNGRLMLYLAAEAGQVHRVFCGLGKRVK